MIALRGWLKDVPGHTPCRVLRGWALLAPATLCCIAPCRADNTFLQLSAGSTVVRGPAPVLDLGYIWPSSFARRDFWKADLTVIGPSTWSGEHAPTNGIARGLYVTGLGHLDLGLGAAYMQHYLPYNGSHVNVAVELAYRFDRWPVTLTYLHMSNLGVTQANYGRDILTIGYRFSPGIYRRKGDN